MRLSVQLYVIDSSALGQAREGLGGRDMEEAALNASQLSTLNSSSGRAARLRGCLREFFRSRRSRGGQGETLVLPTAVAGANRDPGGDEGFVLRARSVLSSD